MDRRSIPALLVALTLLAGCQPEPIVSYRVPRHPKPPPRLLGAIAPVGESVWFVKLTGPAPEVAAHDKEFEQFVRSLHFADDPKQPLTWTLPPGWREAAAAPVKPGLAEQTRFATIRVGPESLKLTISRLGQEAGDILPNVNRWRRNDLNLPPLADAGLPAVTRKVTAGGHEVTVVDMTGVAKGEEPADEEPAAPAPAPPGELAYDAPPGWQPLPATGMRVAAFKVTDGGQSAEVTVIPLAGQAGGLLSNVNRWRDQIGLPDTTVDRLTKEAKMLDSPAGAVVYVDLTGPKGRTLGGVLSHGGRSWFVKLQGPAELVGKQQAAFEAFVKSLRFAAAGAK
ncbi:MAG TPA: hypothetical protein VGF55_28870 [Gemmataceae bacterium]|jgi:hypothetical protein